jgi:hypothetical protein
MKGFQCKYFEIQCLSALVNAILKCNRLIILKIKMGDPKKKKWTNSPAQSKNTETTARKLTNFTCMNIVYFRCISIKSTNHQQMHKESFIINSNTLLHVSTLLGHRQGELFVIVTLRLHFRVEWECAELSVVPASQRVHDSKNNAVHSQQHILIQL